MAGWYSDAFSSNMSKVNTKNITSDSGLGIKEFGDAFAKIGKAMQDDELNQKKNKALDMQIQEQEQKATNDRLVAKAKEFDNPEAFGKWKLDEQTKLDEKYNKENAEYQDRTISKLWTDKPQKETLGSMNAKGIEDVEKFYKGKFTGELEKEISSGKYKTWDDVIKDKKNIDLIAGADPKRVFELKEKLTPQTKDPKKTNEIINYEYGKTNPEFAKQQQQKKKDEDKPVSPSTIKTIDGYIGSKLEQPKELIEQKNDDGTIDYYYADDKDMNTIDPDEAKEISTNNMQLKIKNDFIRSKTAELMEDKSKKLNMNQAFKLATKEYNDFVNADDPAKLDGAVDLSDKTEPKNIKKENSTDSYTNYLPK
jgi:hypothetical protein